MRIEISLERARQLYQMMLFLEKRNYHLRWDTSMEGMIEIYRLRDQKGKLVAELEIRNNTQYYQDYV